MRTTKSDMVGAFRFAKVNPGRYEIEVKHDGFVSATVPIALADRSPAPLQITLQLTDIRQELTVSDAAEQVSTAAADNASAVTLDRSLLDNLPVFDQNYIAAMQQFLDPGSVSTGGVTLIVNGMEQKNVGVSASAIQQVKINQNPYSAEFARPGRGAIEILTKPSSLDYHGTFNFLFRDQHLNARDAFASVRAPEQRRVYEGSLAGPLGRNGRDSFLISVNREELDAQSLVFANAPTGILRQNIPDTLRNTEFSAGVTHPFSDAHIGSFRMNYRETTEMNRGVGGFVLPESGVNYRDTESEVYYNDSMSITPTLFNQVRVLIGRQYTPTTSVTHAPSIVVPGAFTGGGAQADQLQTEVHGTFNDILSWSHGKHDVKAGVNIPDVSRRGLNDLSSFAGTYTFSNLADYLQQRPFSLIQQRGDGHAIFMEAVIGAFIQDEFRIRPNLTITAGLRFDWQNFFHDNNNFSPRISFAWSPMKSRKTVLRFGSGMFYDRTGPGPLFDLKRYNGLQLQRLVISNPSYPEMPISALPTSIVRLDPTMKFPYMIQFSAGVDQQIAKGATLSINYWGVRGVGMFRSRDVNAPPPPNYLSRPDPVFSVYRQIESSGHLESNALEVMFRGKIGSRFTGMAQYTLGRTMNDVPGNYVGGARSTGINNFPANNYDLSGECGRADYDQRHRLNLLGGFHAARYADFGVGLTASTGMPYSITTGTDDYRTGYANARPVGVRRNTDQGPGLVNLDLRWSHNFAFTKKKDGPSVTVAADAFNAINHVNYAGYIGNLSSPFFGEAVAAKPPRRLQISLRFSF